MDLSLPLLSRCRVALLLGSGLNATDSQQWKIPGNVSVVCVNNAYRVRDDWQYMLHALDFPSDKRPQHIQPGQTMLSGEAYVPAMNAFGGIVYCGATMAFAGAYWALHNLRPHVLAILGCDMDYQPQEGKTHFYGTGTPDPLRQDPTLRNLRAKSARMYLLALGAGTIVVNLSRSKFSRLTVPRADVDDVFAMRRWQHQLMLRRMRASIDRPLIQATLDKEERVGYRLPDGVYWTRSYDLAAIDEIDAGWASAMAAVPVDLGDMRHFHSPVEGNA